MSAGATWSEGSILDLARRSLSFQRDPLRFFAELRESYGPTVVFARSRRRARDATPERAASSRPLIVTSDRALVREILTDSRYRNSALALSGPRGSSHRRIRHSLFRMHGEEHRRHRSLIAPALQKRAALAHVASMSRVVEGVSRDWRAGQKRDLAEDMKELALHIAATTLFGLSDLDESGRIGSKIEDWWGDNFRFLPRVLPWNLPGTPFRRMLRKAAGLEHDVRAMIERKRAELHSGSNEESVDLLSRLIRARDGRGGLDEDELLGQSHVLFLAAHETTAYALTWTLFLLAQHPHAAEELCEELTSVLGGKAPSPEQLDSLPRLSRVIDESLRILPIVPFGARIAAEPTEIAGRPFPRKSRILIPFHLIHHDPALYPSPRRFDPDRWIDFEPAPYTYLPFSAGQHMCIGINFARISLQVTLAILLQRFRFKVRDGARIDRRVTVTLSPRRGMPVELGDAGAAWIRTRVSGDVRDLVDLD